MKVYSVVQGSPEWLQLRAGIPTASEFDSIITPGGKPSKSVERYMFSLLAERIMGHPRIESVSTWMDRGAQMEEEAVSFYELQRDTETVKVGFITNDAGTIGASPDRLVGEDGLLEIKVPSEHVHVSYLLKKSVDAAYYPQVQGQLWIAERRWVDILSYHPEMPPALIRVARDETFIPVLAEAVNNFAVLLEGNVADLVKRGWIHSNGISAAVSEPPEPEDAPQPRRRATRPPVPITGLNFKEFMERMAKAKEAIGEADYYRVLKAHNVQHANQIKELPVQAQVLLEMSDCHRAQQARQPQPAAEEGMSIPVYKTALEGYRAKDKQIVIDVLRGAGFESEYAVPLTAQGRQNVIDVLEKQFGV